MDAANDQLDDLLDLTPQPGDEEFITRGEHRRLIAVMVHRFSRIESFLFDDEKDARGSVVTPSLKTVTSAVHNHIRVLCSWARFFKWVGIGLATFGGAFFGAAEAVARFEMILGFFR